MQPRQSLRGVITLCSVGLLLLFGCGPTTVVGGNQNQNTGNEDGGDTADAYVQPTCPGGTDLDGDGYGVGCPAGSDCDDSNEHVHPGATEVCNTVDDNCNGQTDEGVLSPCGDCNPGCTEDTIGDDPFPMPPADPNADADGVGLDPNGDLILDQNAVDFNFMWIANTNDLSRGTVSKIDTVQAKEKARYYSVTCFGHSSWQNGDCKDVAGNDLYLGHLAPSRTAVDFNFDVWVANRTFHTTVMPSVTKIANDLSDCVDRNNNGQIDTSKDWDDDGIIDTDCNSDGQPDDIMVTNCDNQLPPEFLGPDDECILFTTMYAAGGDVGRSVCLDGGDQYYGGAGNAWAGTNARSGNNRFYQINGTTGQIMATADLPAGHNPYGCAVDSTGILWTVSQAGFDDNPGHSNPSGRLAFLDVYNPTNVGPLLPHPSTDVQFYGVAIDSEDNIWAGGWSTSDVFRFRPNRSSFGTLQNGTWTRVRTSELTNVNRTAGIAADLRGYIWAASDDTGYIIRIPQSLADGEYPGSVAQVYGNGFGGQMRGVGVDFNGHLWGISHDNSRATRMDVDANGNPLGTYTPMSVGANPYTYSDFTGYGLRNFTRPRGTYNYLLEGCDDPQVSTWIRVEWNATLPQDTAVFLRVRAGDGPGSMGTWFGPWETSPAILADPPLGPVDPNPARFLQVEFELTTQDRETTPILHDFNVVWLCTDIPD